MTAQEFKNSILQLAVQGKLVEQRPEEGTAKELYQQMVEEKAKLIKEGKIKKEKPFDKIVDDSIPWEIPDGWKWVRFFEVTINRDAERIPLSVSERENLIKKYDYYGASGVIDKVDRYLFDKDLLLIGEDGANLLNRSTPIAFIAKGKYWVNNHAHVLDCLSGMHMEYLAYYINAISLAKYVTGTAQPKMNQARMNGIWVPLPPFEEQKRIVAKIEEILPYIEQYDKAYTKLEAFNKKFPEDMKKSVLQLAMQGKLVERRPEEGTAEELYQQILQEKAKLIKEGKIKKEKPLAEITDDEIPFEIPESWKWVRLGEIMSINSGKGLVAKDMIDNGIPVYGGNGITGYHNVSNINKETIVIGRVGYYCGSVHITPNKAWITDNAFITTYTESSIDRDYFVYILRHLNLGKSNNATAQPVVSGKKIYPILFPLPPLAEQKRIVAKIEEILPYCEQLIK